MFKVGGINCILVKSLFSDMLLVRGRYILIFLTLCAACFSVQADTKFVSRSPDSSEADGRVLMGWLESVYIMPWGRRLTAKLDTGANGSSLHADKIEHFSKGEEQWVRFTLGDVSDGKTERIEAERPLLRTAYIKSHTKMSSKRDVVMLTVCKNGREYETEFNLVDRSNFNYPVLLGRSFLAKVAFVDPATTFIYKGESDECANRKSSLRSTP